MQFAVLILLGAVVGGGSPVRLADSQALKTWWHANAELNDSTPVADTSVRRSTVYRVKVATAAAPDVLYDSFVYMTLLRSGGAKRGYISQDGAEFADEANLTMSWTSFLYGSDTWVQVELDGGPPLRSVDDVTIRPTTLQFRKQLVDERTVRILVPWSRSGYRFSVEVASQLVTSYKDQNGRLTTEGAGRPAVHTEPRNAMLIFAEPMPKGDQVDRVVPDPSHHSIFYPREGEVTNLGDVKQEVIYFRPGTYVMPAESHTHLRRNVRWVYLAPGAYVKGAFQFRSGPTQFKVTGFGVLSGEKYVYEADRANHYRHRLASAPNCHRTCVKMLEFEAGSVPQQLTLHGITVVEPPYHSFVAYGYERQFRIDVGHFKQVGGWYWQTDGIELYRGSVMRDSFFHANDDVLKLYASDLVVRNIVVWKPENGPVIQLGWRPRTIDNVHVDGVDVIHNRMHWPAHNSCIINSARHWADPSSDRTADPRTSITNVTLENIRSEGMNLCAMRLYALSNWEQIHIKNLWIERWNQLDPKTQASHFEALANERGVRVTIGNETRDGRGLGIENYVVKRERIIKSGRNWRADQLGRLDFAPDLWPNWDAR